MKIIIFLDLFPKREITQVGNYIQHNINNTELQPPYFKELTDRDLTCISDFKKIIRL